MIHLVIGIIIGLIVGVILYLLSPLFLFEEFLNRLNTFFPYGKEISFYEEDSIDEIIGFIFRSLGENNEINFFFLPFILKTIFYHKFNPFLGIKNGLETIHPRGFQRPESFNMELLIDTHNLIFAYCVFIFIFVSFFMGVTVYYYKSTRLENKKLFSRFEEWFYLYERGMTRKEEEELYFLDQYYFVTTADSVFLESIPLRKNFNIFYNYNQIENKSLKFETISNRSRKKLWDNVVVEVIWTLIPTLILVAIAIPSFTLLYALEPTVFYDQNAVFVKIIGHQWYWSYEFPEETFNLLQKKGNFPPEVEKSFSSYMLPISELKGEMPRLLSVDNPLYLPINSNIIIRVTSEDVIHSWAIPSLGVKLDCIPGRINEFVFRIRSVGDLYGQCSELCGVNHGFMPIHVIAYEV